MSTNYTVYTSAKFHREHFPLAGTINFSSTCCFQWELSIYPKRLLNTNVTLTLGICLRVFVSMKEKPFGVQNNMSHVRHELEKS